MTKIELEIFDDVVTTINKIKAVNDSGIELVIPEDSLLLDNLLTLKLIKREAMKEQKNIHFITAGQHPMQIEDDLEDETIENLFESQEELNQTSIKFAPPALDALKKKLTNFFHRSATTFKMPKLDLKFKSTYLIFLAIFGVGILFLFFLYKAPKANIKIIVNSEPIARSIQMKVKENASSDSVNKTLRGTVLATTLAETGTTPTTGEKTVGKRAEGKIKIFNKTTEEKEFKEGHIIIYEKDDDEFNFVLKADVKVPARTETAAENPADPPIITLGEEEVGVRAELIGSEYNLEAGTTLEVKGEDKDDFSAVVSSDTIGGKSELAKVVSTADKTKLSTDIKKILTEKAESELKKKVGTGQKLIPGTIQVKVINERYNAELNAEEDILELSQTVEVKGLVYLESDLNNILDTLVKDFIPEGYILSEKERAVNTEVLRATGSTVLTETEADIQVTLKTYIVSNITENDVKANTKGKNTEEATKYLNTIRNIKSYSIDISPSIPFLKNVPKDENRINVELVRE